MSSLRWCTGMHNILFEPPSTNALQPESKHGNVIYFLQRKPEMLRSVFGRAPTPRLWSRNRQDPAFWGLTAALASSFANIVVSAQSFLLPSFLPSAQSVKVSSSSVVPAYATEATATACRQQGVSLQERLSCHRRTQGARRRLSEQTSSKCNSSCMQGACIAYRLWSPGQVKLGCAILQGLHRGDPSLFAHHG